MSFPLKERIVGGYRFGQRTFYGTRHTGTDYKAVNVPYVSPYRGIATTGNGYQGGWWWTLEVDDAWRIIPGSKKIRLTARHLQGPGTTGFVIEGQPVATTGNSGAFTTNAHLHQEVEVDGRLVDPETFNWNYELPGPVPPPPVGKTFMEVTFVANKINWPSLDAQIQILCEWIKNYSGNKLEIVPKLKRTNFDFIPLTPFLNSDKNCVDINWYRKNITPLAEGQATILLLNRDQYQNGLIFAFCTFGDPHKPVRLEVSADENEIVDGTPIFVIRAFHELCHAFYFLTGQQDSYGNSQSTVHDFLYQNPPKYADLLHTIDHKRLQDSLVSIQY